MNKLPRPRRVWVPITLILAFGIVIGLGISIIVIKKAGAAITTPSTSSIPVAPGRTATQITDELRAKAHLSEEQAQAVQRAYEQRLQAISAIRDEAMRKIGIEHENLRSDMRTALTAEQFAQWDSHFQTQRSKSHHASSTTSLPQKAGTLPSVDEMFDRFDGNHDGKLGPSEIPADSLDRLMRADENHDGSVSREELVAARLRAQAK